LFLPSSSISVAPESSQKSEETRRESFLVRVVFVTLRNHGRHPSPQWWTLLVLSYKHSLESLQSDLAVSRKESAKLKEVGKTRPSPHTLQERGFLLSYHAPTGSVRI